MCGECSSFQRSHKPKVENPHVFTDVQGFFISKQKQERRTMINDTAESTPPATTASKLDEALEVVETLKTSCRDALVGLKDLAAKLKAAQKEQKTAEREVQTVRSTLRSLQSMKL